MAEQRRLEAEALRQRDADAAAKRKQEEADARRREETEVAARRREDDRTKRRQDDWAASHADRYAEFRADHDEPTGVLRLMPLAVWAHAETRRPNGDEPLAEDDLQRLIAGLRVPTTVAAVTYPRGCRIRRVRVRAPKHTATTGEKRRTVIVSRRALRGSRDDATG